MTLQQVAQHAGVSASTVSRVINSMPGITSETAESVRRSMQALSYTPTLRRKNGARAASDVAGAKVAFVVLDSQVGQTVPAYDYLLRGVSSAAVQHQLDLHVSFSQEVESTVARLASSSFDGLILHGRFVSLEQSRPLQQIPTVWMLGNRRRPVWGDQVMPDNATVGQIAAQYLLRREHRRVMYFGLLSGWSLGVRMLAFQQGIEDAGASVVTIAPRMADFDRFTHDTTESALLELVRTYQSSPDAEKPTGLFISEDWLVRPVYQALREAGIDVGPGKSLDVISCNNDRPHLVGVTPMPATIDIRYEAIGYRAVEQLTFLINRKGKAPQDRVRMMLEPILVPPPTEPV